MVTRTIHLIGPEYATVLPGQTAEIGKVVVLGADTGKVAPDSPVTVRTLRGTVAFGPEETPELTVRSDDEGQVAITGGLRGDDPALVIAEIGKGSTEGMPVLIRVLGPGHLAEISVVAPPEVSADDGDLIVDIRGLDAWGGDCETARFRMSACLSKAGISEDGDVNVVRGSVKKAGFGHWRGRLQIRQAGAWSVSVTDRVSGSRARATVVVTAGKVADIVLVGDDDPRSDPPYDRTTLRLQIRDAHGNALGNPEVSASAGGQTLDAVTIDHVVHVPVRSVGFQEIEVAVRVPGTDAAWTGTVLFAAYWMENPKLIPFEEDTRLSVLMQPPPDRAVGEGRLTIGTDPAQGRPDPDSIEPAPGTSVTVSRVTDDRLEVEYRADPPVAAKDHPAGRPLLSFVWSCTARGQTCFDVGGGMSPDVPHWIMCPEQKRKKENQPKVCVNIIYRPRHIGDRASGTSIMLSAFETIRRMEYFCCPWLRYCWEHHEMTRDEHVRLATMWNDWLPTVTCPPWVPRS